MLRSGMPVVEQRVTLRAGRIARLELAQRPAQTLSGEVPWIQRTEVLVAWHDRPPKRIPVELRPGVTEVKAAEGLPAPDFVFASGGNSGYFLTLLDTASVRALEAGALGRVSDDLLRAMLWGALWDQVRASRMTPARFVRLALNELPGEKD